jgi:hypothetical protein
VDVSCQVKYVSYIALAPIPVAARSKAWVCDGSVAGISSSNPPGGLVVSLCFLSVISCQKPLLLAYPEEYYRMWFV